MTLRDPAYHTLDTPYTDPALVQLMIILGKSPYWEVQLALGEFNDNRAATSTRALTSPTFYTEIPPEVILDPGCPTLDQYVWVNRGGRRTPIQAHNLPKYVGEEVIWNPLERAYKTLVSAEIIPDTPLLYSVSAQGVASRTSTSHKIVRHKKDFEGFDLRFHRLGSDLLRCKRYAFPDILAKKEKAGRGSVMKIEVEGHIYVTGASPDEGIVSHNLKSPDDIE